MKNATRLLWLSLWSATLLAGVSMAFHLPLPNSHRVYNPHLASPATTTPPKSIQMAINSGKTDEKNTRNSQSIRERSFSDRQDVSLEVAQMLYEDLLLGRYLENKVAEMYYKGSVSGFVHLYNGQEAISTGIIKALRKDDYVTSNYRDHVHATSKGIPARQVLAELYGKETGCSKGRGGSMHMFSKKHNFLGGFAFIGEQIPIAIGAGFASVYRKYTPEINDKDATQVSVCFLGDGTVNMGQYFEALNMAALAKLPVIFVIENNNWAIGMAAYRSSAVPEAHKKSQAFGIPSVEVDGMDVLAVRSVARKAIERARNGYGPTVIEALTYRFRGHSVADPDEIRAPLERKTWSNRDPLVTFENYMKEMGYANEAVLQLTQEKVKAVVEDAIQFALDSPNPHVEELGHYVFSDHYKPQPETLTDQDLHAYAKALAEELQLEERRAAGERNPGIPVQLSTNALKVIN